MGPTTSTPVTCFSSLSCCTARSASPVTSGSAVKPDGMIRARALISEAISIRSISCAKKIPLAPMREYATDRAPSSVTRRAASVAMSGCSGPAFTAMPTKERARSTRLSATTVPCAERSSSAWRVRMTTSAPSPPFRRSSSPSVGAKSASMRAPPAASYRPARLRTGPIKASVESRRTTFSIGNPSSRLCGQRSQVRSLLAARCAFRVRQMKKRPSLSGLEVIRRAGRCRAGGGNANGSHERSNAMIRQNAQALWRIRLRPGPSGPGRVSNLLGRGRLGSGRHGRDRLQDLRSDLVGVALRVRTAIFQIPLVAAIGEAMGHADRGTAVRDTIAELGDRSGLVLAGQPQMVIRAIDRDVIGAVCLERFHQLLEIFLAAHFAHKFGGEVGVHAGAVPVGVTERFAMEFDIDPVLLGQPQHQIAGHPHFVGSAFGALAENLEFPLALRDFRVDALVVDAGGEAEIEMLFHHLARDVADIRVADAVVIRPLRCGIAA